MTKPETAPTNVDTRIYEANAKAFAGDAERIVKPADAPTNAAPGPARANAESPPATEPLEPDDQAAA